MIKGMNHVGISVVNLERSLYFYRDLLGMRVVEHGEVAGESYERVLGLVGARGVAVLLRLNDMQVELFQFTSPTPRPSEIDYPVCDHRITHFCIEVVDIKMEYERLRVAGVVFHCPPVDFSGVAKATYGRDPDGNVFELWEKTVSASGSGASDRQLGA